MLKKILKNKNKIKVNASEKRPSWDNYFMKIAMLVSERATCLRHHVGAIIVKDKKILTTGYNGAARGIDSCLDKNYCLRNKLNIPSGTRHEICMAIHAEQNAIIQAGYHGININNATIYCTHTPCILCAKMIVNSGIKRVVTFADYPSEDSRALFKQSGIIFDKLPKPKQEIDFLE